MHTIGIKLNKTFTFLYKKVPFFGKIYLKFRGMFISGMSKEKVQESLSFLEHSVERHKMELVSLASSQGHRVNHDGLKIEWEDYIVHRVEEITELLQHDYTRIYQLKQVLKCDEENLEEVEEFWDID